MPVSGSGIIPASGAIYSELGYLTRRAFVPKMIVQVYQASPTIATFLANAQSASGGVSPITVPVQGGQFVKTAAAGYDGSFAAPQALQGAYNAEFNLGSIVTPIPFLGMESMVQINAAVIPILEARMNDAGNSQAEYYSLALWNSDATTATSATDAFGNTLTYSALDISGFPALFSATTTYGGLSRSSYSWFQPGIKAVTGSPAPTRASVLQYIISATKTNGGEMPNFGVTGMGTWSLLAQDFLAQEYYTVGPGEGFDKAAGGVRAAFVALVVGGVPIYCDPYATEGSFYFFNDKYACFYLHEDASFAFCVDGQEKIPVYGIGSDHYPTIESLEGKNCFDVLSYDKDSKNTVLGRVDIVRQTGEKRCVTVNLNTGRRNPAEPKGSSEWSHVVSFDHPFLDASGQYVPAEKLAPGQLLRAAYTPAAEVVSVTEAGTRRVFDLRVDKFHNFALESGVFTHNTGFASSLSNFQLGYVGAVVTLGQFVCMKPKAATVVTGYSYNTV